MRPHPAPFSHHRCRATHRLRRRARDAEARAAFWMCVAAQAQDEARAAVAEARERAEAETERRMRAETAARREREALVAFVESPEWSRDLWLLLRERLRGEFVAAIYRRKACSRCGGFGRAFIDTAFVDRIRALEAEHGLAAADTAAGKGAPRYGEPVSWEWRLSGEQRKAQALDSAPPERRAPERDRWGPAVY